VEGGPLGVGVGRAATSRMAKLTFVNSRKPRFSGQNGVSVHGRVQREEEKGQRAVARTPRARTRPTTSPMTSSNRSASATTRWSVSWKGRPQSALPLRLVDVQLVWALLLTRWWTEKSGRRLNSLKWLQITGEDWTKWIGVKCFNHFWVFVRHPKWRFNELPLSNFLFYFIF
jgi:hypothetical protein